MGLQNFEKDFRQKLRDREINPSAVSWDRLEAQLETREEKKGYSFWWIGIAACIAGAVLIINQFYFITDNTASQEVVESAVEAEPTEEVPGAIEIPEVEETVLAVDEQKELIQTTPTAKKQQEINPKPKAAVAQAVAEVHDPVVEEKNQTVLNQHEEALVSSKLEEVVAEVASREETGEVTDAEIDALLHRAATELETGRASAVSTANVDPRSLLLEVEMELERSFREKVLDLLREGYMRTRTAVANRGF